MFLLLFCLRQFVCRRGCFLLALRQFLLSSGEIRCCRIQDLPVRIAFGFQSWWVDAKKEAAKEKADAKKSAAKEKADDKKEAAKKKADEKKEDANKK